MSSSARTRSVIVYFPQGSFYLVITHRIIIWLH